MSCPRVERGSSAFQHQDAKELTRTDVHPARRDFVLAYLLAWLDSNQNLDGRGQKAMLRHHMSRPRVERGSSALQPRIC
jgi:hypothetical protein